MLELALEGPAARKTSSAMIGGDTTSILASRQGADGADPKRVQTVVHKAWSSRKMFEALAVMLGPVCKVARSNGAISSLFTRRWADPTPLFSWHRTNSA